MRRRWTGMQVFTIGHSTRPIDEFVGMLRAFEVTVLVDIRTIPRSLRNPQYQGDALRDRLRVSRIRYVHLPELGGLRRPDPRMPDVNGAWRNASFHGYADYMQTRDFQDGLRILHELARDGRVAVMCAEAVPWRCHRSLVADALTVRGACVNHITSATRAMPHRLTSFAMVVGEQVTYPGPLPEPATAGVLVPLGITSPPVRPRTRPASRRPRMRR